MKQINRSLTSGMLLDGRYKLLYPLSSDGGTADVWLALDINTIDDAYDDNYEKISSEESGIKVAIKIYRPKNALDLGEQRFRDEFKIVFNCHHTNLVQPINFSICDGVPYLVLPYCKSGSSEQLQGKFSDKVELWRYIANVSAGLHYLHTFNPTIVHHDIKPANILIDDSGNYAITDFGISSHRGLNREGYDESQSGTMAYMAPERFKEDYESIPESDIWSFGATLYELITGSVPFGESGGVEQLEGSVTLKPITEPVPKDVKRLIYDCLALDPSKRPSAKTIHRAALAQSYPPRPFVKYVIMAVIAIVAIMISYLALRPKQEVPVLPTPPVPLDVRFNKAMSIIDNNDEESLRLGLAMLDSLSVQRYVPALYQLAFTYGWYSDDQSVARKRLLGIETYSKQNTKNEAEYTLPISDNINNKAIGLLTRIVEINDSNYADINANALYRLACYYTMTNKVVRNDLDKGEALLKQARQWAIICDDQMLIDRIDRGLQSLEK